jgi:PPOX class probable FMN-dependent enzyme
MALPDLRRIRTESELRAIIGEPSALVCSKLSDRLNPVTRRFVELSPLVMLATAGADGTCDVSPRGDGPGFVRILDDQTLMMPDRPGNRLADALRNILATGRAGLLFLIPGVTESFRVNGRAWITDDAALLADSAVEGKPPRLGLVIEIEEAFAQCSKALLRSDTWNPERFRRRDELPSNGEIMRSVNPGLDAAEYDAARDARYARREGFY